MNKNEVWEDVLGMQDVLTGNSAGGGGFSKYDKVYGFTNEALKNYLPLLGNQEGAKVLTVTGSGDQPLELLLQNPESITAFDINKLTYYWLQLKIAGVLTMPFDEFKTTFVNVGDYLKPMTIDKQSLRNMMSAMPADVREFWNSVFSRHKNISFFCINSSYNAMENSSYCSEPEKYKLLGQLLQDKKINFILSDMKNLPDIKGNFDTMLLSNIADYAWKTKRCSKHEPHLEFIKNSLIKKLSPPHGIIQADYIWTAHGSRYQDEKESGKYKTLNIDIKPFKNPIGDTEKIVTIQHNQ